MAAERHLAARSHRLARERILPEEALAVVRADPYGGESAIDHVAFVVVEDGEEVMAVRGGDDRRASGGLPADRGPGSLEQISI